MSATKNHKSELQLLKVKSELDKLFQVATAESDEYEFRIQALITENTMLRNQIAELVNKIVELKQGE